MSQQHLLQIVHSIYDAIIWEYSLPGRFDNFPTLVEAFQEYGGASRDECLLLDQLFAAHEIGHAPADHRKFLHATAATHHLGIVSNFFALPNPWLKALRQADVLSLFQTTVFSLDGRSIKSSRLIFERALAMLPPSSTILFAGDSLERDIIPAIALGLGTAWIAPSGMVHPAADVVIESLPALRDLPPNRSFEQTSVGNPPYAAQLQR